MRLRATPKATGHGTRFHRQQRAWPPPCMKEPANVARITPRRWLQPALWYIVQAVCLVIALTGMQTTQSAIAQGTEEVSAGTLLFRSGEDTVEAPRVHTDVNMEISGIVARVRVRQQFRNPGDRWVEGLYAFPLPENSAVNQLHMEVGERVIVGEIREKAAAQQLFEKARNNGQRASIVHQQRPNIFRTAVANIGPHETITITMTYLQIVEQHDGRYSLRFPLTITPRYIPGVIADEGVAPAAGTPVAELSPAAEAHDTAQLGDLQPALAHPDVSRQSVRFDISLDAGVAIERVSSTYHPVRIQTEAGTWRVTSAEGTAPDRDFELAWTPVVQGGPAAALFRERTDSGEHVLLMFMPPQDRTLLTARRELIFIIDTSGSMGGQSIEQARAALLAGLATLRPGDRFNLIQFNSTFEALFEEPVDATPDNVDWASRYVGELRATGGTEMLPALSAAMSMPASPGHLRQILFITDGAVSNEDELMRVIREDLREARLFTVGIGSAPNGYFMRKAAQMGRGTFTYIGATSEVSERMNALLRKLTAPVLTDIELQWPEGAKPQYAPEQVGDLYADEPLVISARVQGTAKGVLTITGRAAGAWTRQIPLEPAESRNGVATLWARNRIADLMDQRAQGVADAAIRSQVLPLALEYQLVSKYTSLVAVDKTPARGRDASLQSTRIENTKPHGSNWPASGLPGTATPAGLQLLIGVLALTLAAAMRFSAVARRRIRS